MLNVVSLQGNLTRDPEGFTSKGGTQIAKFSLAINRFVNKEKVANFFDCVAFGKTAETILQHCKKGKQVVITGELTQESWEDKSGNKRTKVVINVTPNGMHFVNDGKGSGSASAPRSMVEPTSEPEDNGDVPF